MRSAIGIIPIWLLAAASSALAAQTNRIPATIDSNQTVVLKGSVRSQARSGYDQGAADASLQLPYVVMVMKPSAAQQAELQQLLAQQQDSGSPNYHRWLTPESYADRFGLSRSDTEKISDWLRSQGFTIVQVARGRDWIAFSATAGLVENTFHTQIHRYNLDGESHFANTTELAIPKALEGAVVGFRGLDDFRWKPMGINQLAPPELILPVIVRPFFTTDGGGTNLLAPDDFATIYDIHAAGVDGTGMKLVVVGQVDVVMQDIQDFRSGFKLPANNPTVVVVPGSPDPGNNPGDLLESDLDLEWAGAVAPGAKIIFVTANPSTGGGVFNSVAYAIDNQLGQVISMSYGGCETLNGSFIPVNEPTMLKASAEGITFVAASGDSGPASCDSPSQPSAHGGLSVSYPASSPEVTGVGGNTFSGDVPDPTSYWSTINAPNGGSALTYIPETSWNDTLTRHMLAASGGGKSSCHSSPCSSGFPKPSWQAGPGVPSDGVRDVPDVSFAASPDHDGFMMCNAGSCAGGVLNNFLVVGGTSASAPVFAGIVTLLNQHLVNLPPTGLGNINPTLYKLAQTPANNVFHDITSGDNMVPCASGSKNCPTKPPLQFGYSAGAGFDLVTGLGSVDVNNLFTNWNTGKVDTSATLNATPTTIVAGSSQTLTLTAAISPNSGGGTPTGTVGFLVNGSSPAGTGTLSQGLASLGYNPKSLKAGVNTFTAAYGGDVNFINSQSAGVMITVQDFTMALPSNPTTVTVAAPGGSGTTTVTITPEFGFAQAVGFTCSGLPREATCSAGSVTPNGAAIMATLTITTQGPAARLEPVRSGVLYALLIPSLLGITLLPGSNGKGRLRQARLLGLLVGVLWMTTWLPACGGGSASSTTPPPDPGTPAGSTTVSVVATGVGGAPIHTLNFTLTVK